MGGKVVGCLYITTYSCNIADLFNRQDSLEGISVTMKTYSAKPETVRHDWYLVDAADKTLGRLATEIARRLRGKHKAEYTPHVDTGDYIVVINAAKVRVTGSKTSQKVYQRYTGYPGGIRTVTLEKLLATFPERVIEHAVRGMLPKNPLGRAMFRKLKVYAGATHEHTAQQPQPLELDLRLLRGKSN